jgi:hypothetical protein
MIVRALIEVQAAEIHRMRCALLSVLLVAELVAENQMQLELHYLLEQMQHESELQLAMLD